MLKQLKIYYIFVSLPFVLLLLGSAIFLDAIKSTIRTNPHPQINYAIFTIILFGGIIVILNARRLIPEAKKIVEFSKAIHAKTSLTGLQELANSYTGDLACLLQMVSTSVGRSISHQEQAALEHELANVHSHLNRRNALPNYLTGLLVGMGLLGTFIGLLATLGDITALISSFADLDMSNADPIVVFANMIEKMKAPMSSMAIAFSASMFGLLGSIILGLMMVGIRRLQGDITSTLSSEVARHIELALSFESINSGSGMGAGYTGDIGDVAKVLIRIEERFAESGRLQQRTLSSVIDDFQKQRADMLRALNEQTEASNNFRSELQQRGRQLGRQQGHIFNVMEKGNAEMSAQISELTVSMAADAKQSHILLNNVSNNLRSELQQLGKQLAADAKQSHEQRADMLIRLAEQIETSNNLRSESKQRAKQLGKQLGHIFTVIKKEE